MFRRALVFIAAVGGILLARPGVAQSVSPQAGPHQQAAQSQTNNAPHYQGAPFRLNFATSLPSAERHDRQSALPANQKSNKPFCSDVWGDTCANWTSAISTVIGTFFLVFALFLSIRANQHAAAAAKASDETARTTREIGEAQARAYLHVSDVRLEWGGSTEQRKLQKVTFLVQNSGSSHALNATTNSGVSVIRPANFLDSCDPDKLRKSLRPKITKPNSTVIAANGSRKTMVFNPVTEGDIEDWERGRADILAYAWITYEDVFGKTLFVEYCARFVFEETETTYFTHFENFTPLNNFGFCDAGEDESGSNHV